MNLKHTAVCSIASLLGVALVSTACASTSDTDQVSADSAEYGVRLATSTTVVGGSGAVGGSGSSSGGSGSGGASGLDDLSNLTPEQLAELTGMSIDELSALGITPATVGALGDLIDQIGGTGQASADPALLDALVARGGTLLTSTGQLTTQASQLLATANIDPLTLAAIAGAAATVPPSVTQQLGLILQIVDPNGLGQFNGNTSALSALAIVMGAVLGEDPVALSQLTALGDIDPRFRSVVSFITGLVTSLSPRLIDQINRITKVLGPYTMQALGALFALIERPAVADVISEAFSDPTVVATAFGALFTFIPGLPELLAPEFFGDPNAIYAAVTAIAAMALLNADAPGFREFLTFFGVELPPELQ